MSTTNRTLSCFACCKRHRRVHPGIEIDGILLRSDMLNSYRSKTVTSMVRSTSNFSSIKIDKIDHMTREQYFIARDETPLVEKSSHVSSKKSCCHFEECCGFMNKRNMHPFVLSYIYT
jgi:hypothetical protein